MRLRVKRAGGNRGEAAIHACFAESNRLPLAAIPRFNARAVITNHYQLIRAKKGGIKRDVPYTGSESGGLAQAKANWAPPLRTLQVIWLLRAAACEAVEEFG